jgi:broad specificity phosphatase PhoE
VNLPTGDNFSKLPIHMEEKTTSTRVYLIRHGITDWIEQGILHGITDRPLSPLGLQQADLTAQAMQGVQAAHLFTSPLLRAVQTAEPIGRVTGLQLELVEDFKEMNYGRLEGKKDIWPLFRHSRLMRELYHAMLHLAGQTSGETPKEFEGRVRQAWKIIRSKPFNKPLIIVAHFGVLRSILIDEFGAKDPESMHFSLGVCSISEIEISANSPSRIIRINDTSHLNKKA